MGIKKFKENASKSNLLTGAKKVAVATTLVAAMMVSMPSVAHADVPAAYIVGDAELSEDRTYIKKQDGIDIRNYFEGYDIYGYSNVSEDEIRKAIELSNVLNAYYLSPLYYTNTTKNEILSLDVDGIYNEYITAPNDNGYQAFCDNNLVNKPAIDAYTLFACGTVSRNIKNTIANEIYSIIYNEHPYSEITYPTIIVNDSEAYAVFTVDGTVQKVTLLGDIIDTIKTICPALDNRYNMALNNLSGLSNDYEDSFAYNGVDRYTKESVWLSFPDDSRKTDLTTALDLSTKIYNSDNCEISIEAPTSSLTLSKEEKKELRNLGYNHSELKYATKRNASINSVPIYTFK